MNDALNQLYVFFANVFCGIINALLFHLSTYVRPKKYKKAVGVICDATVASFFLLSCWAVNFYFNYGEFRLYLPFGILSGVCIYVFAVKSTLDKAKVSLYNLLTVKKESKSDGKDILQ